MNDDFVAIGTELSSTLRRLGMGDVDMLFAIVAAWPGVTEEPWTSGAEPVMLQQGELTVRAKQRGSIRALSYGVNSLIDRLNEALDRPVVESVRVVGPSRGT